MNDEQLDPEVELDEKAAIRSILNKLKDNGSKPKAEEYVDKLKELLVLVDQTQSQLNQIKGEIFLY